MEKSLGELYRLGILRASNLCSGSIEFVVRVAWHDFRAPLGCGPWGATQIELLYFQ